MLRFRTQGLKLRVSMKLILERSIPLNPKRKSELIMAASKNQSTDAAKKAAKKMPPFIAEKMQKGGKKPAGKMPAGKMGKKK